VITKGRSGNGGTWLERKLAVADAVIPISRAATERMQLTLWSTVESAMGLWAEREGGRRESSASGGSRIRSCASGFLVRVLGWVEIRGIYNGKPVEPVICRIWQAGQRSRRQGASTGHGIVR
jgi:hypothetical protein